jgi:hypothetical protein
LKEFSGLQEVSGDLNGNESRNLVEAYGKVMKKDTTGKFFGRKVLNKVHDMLSLLVGFQIIPLMIIVIALIAEKDFQMLFLD